MVGKSRLFRWYMYVCVCTHTDDVVHMFVMYVHHVHVRLIVHCKEVS
jgi:hypothetical protein